MQLLADWLLGNKAMGLGTDDWLLGLGVALVTTDEWLLLADDFPLFAAELLLGVDKILLRTDELLLLTMGVWVAMELLVVVGVHVAVVSGSIKKLWIKK